VNKSPLFFFFVAILLLSIIPPCAEGQARAGKHTGVEVPPNLAEGLAIGLVYVHFEKSTGDQVRDERLRQGVLHEALQADVAGGASFNTLVADMAVKRIAKVPSIERARYAVYQTDNSADRIAVVFFIEAVSQEAAEPKKPKGMLPSGTFREWPLIYENDSSRLTFILNGGFGAYTDTDPFFGWGKLFNERNPIADKPAGRGTTAVAESYLEPGIGGITRLGDTPFYPYGAFTYMGTWSSGSDVYSGGSRTYGDVEKAYAGVIYDLPGKDNVLNISYGRQEYQLRDGFLISKIPGSTDAGHRGALNLGPRNTYKRAGFARLRLGSFAFEGFLVQPEELRDVRTDTRILGANVQYNFPSGLEPAFAFIYVPKSEKTYIAAGGRRLLREGLRTFNPALTLKRLFGVEGLWLKAEYAYQDNEDFDMEAHAYYGWAGYRAARVSWGPTVSYRYSFFSGDNPRTRTFERFDPLTSGTQNFFLPGLISSKVVQNANLRTHRVTFSVYPRQTLELMLEYFHHSADRLNNLGGVGPLQTLQSHSLVQELAFNTFWFMGKNYFFQGVAATAIPGSAIKRAVPGSTDNWYCLQASLYFFF